MKTTTVETAERGRSPLGAHVRLLMDGRHGDGVCVDIPLGTAFQYRCTGSVPVVLTCTALPPWPGDEEAVIVDGPWVPCVDF